jgi:hypothetical protein
MAKVVYWKPDVHDILQLPSVYQAIEEDIAGLELLEQVPELQPVQMQSYSDNLEFKALGYPKKTPQGAVAQGKIQSEIPFGWVQIDGNSQEGFWVAPGYSGTPIWDLENGNVTYGMMVAVRKEDDMAKKIAYMIPYEKLKRSIAFLQLLNLLPQPESVEDALWKEYEVVYRQCTPPDWNPAMSMPETPSEMLTQIGDMGQSNLVLSGQAVERTWEFVARFLEQSCSVSESQKQALRDWGVQQHPEFLSLIDAVRNERGEQSGLVRNQTIADPCLLIEVFPSHPSYSTRAFFISNAATYNPNDRETWKEIFCWDFQQKRESIKDLEPFSSNIEGELKSRLSGYIKTCERKYQPDRQFRLELILPIALMNLPIEIFELEYGAYQTVIPGSTFPVVVRSYERTTEEYWEDLGVMWKHKWQRLKENAEVFAHQCLIGVPAKVKVSQLDAHYQTNPRTVGFKLLEILQSPLQKEFLAALLGAAAPTAIWLRRSLLVGSDSEDNPVQRHFDEFLQCHSSPACILNHLPRRALQVRAEAIAVSPEPDDENFRLGHHLSLLWENPNLLPPRAPKQVSE